MTDDAKAVEMTPEERAEKYVECGEMIMAMGEKEPDSCKLARSFLALRQKCEGIANELQCLCMPINRICTKHKLLKALGSEADG